MAAQMARRKGNWLGRVRGAAARASVHRPRQRKEACSTVQLQQSRAVDLLQQDPAAAPPDRPEVGQPAEREPAQPGGDADSGEQLSRPQAVLT